MGRVAWKTNILPRKVYKNILKKQKLKVFSFFQRGQKLTQDFQNSHLNVYNGQTFQSLEIKSAMLGFTVGDFVSTRQSFGHKKAVKKKR